MRKILISLLLIILFVILGTAVISGLHINDYHLGYSIKEIIDKNYELDQEISTLGSKIKNDYVAAQSSLNSSLVNLQNEKENYLNKVKYVTEEEIQKANVAEQYKISYIWTNIGLYATKNYCHLKEAAVSNASSGVANQYDITFYVDGEYLDISNFIYAIEKDPNLGFRIEEFNLLPYTSSSGQSTGIRNNGENALQATFMIKNVTLDPTSLTTDGISDAKVSTNTPDGDASNVDDNQNTGS